MHILVSVSKYLRLKHLEMTAFVEERSEYTYTAKHKGHFTLVSGES